MVSPMRSFMFVPGNRQKFLDKAAVSPVDCAILDLEDGVVAADKAAARAMVVTALGNAGFGPLRFVRINQHESPWYEADLDAVAVAGLAGVCVPKVDTTATVHDVARRLDDAEAQLGLAAGSLRIVPAIESATGLINAAEIARAHPRVLGLMFGAEDYALSTGITTHRTGAAADMVYPRSMVVVACAAAQVLSIDGVYPMLDDPDGMTVDCLRARELGFTSKSTFNPRQVEEINRVFSPLAEEIAYARRVVTGFTEATERGDASVLVGGQLVDRPIVMRAQRVLACAEGWS